MASGRPGERRADPVRALIYRLIWRPALAEIVGDGRPWTVPMISLLSTLQIDARDAEVRMSELPLDHDQRHTFVRHLDRMGVSQLMLVPTSAQASIKPTCSLCRRVQEVPAQKQSALRICRHIQKPSGRA